jgi:hypothetical protein
MHKWLGFGISSKHPFIIPNAATGANVAAVDLGRVYAWVVIRISSTAGIPGGRTLTIHVGMESDDTLVALSDDNLPLAADATGQHVIFVGGARRIRLVLSGNTNAIATIDVYGIDAAEKLGHD